MKKVSTVAAKANRKISEQKLTVGAGGPAFDRVGVTYKAGAPSFAPFAKGGNYGRLLQGLLTRQELEKKSSGSPALMRKRLRLRAVCRRGKR